MNLECSAPFFVYTGAVFSSRLPPLLPKWKPHPDLLTPYSTISATGTPGVMSAKDVYRPSDSEPKCPETLVNKQKKTCPALRDQEAAGSNPVTPMRKPAKSLRFGGFSFFAFGGLTTCRTIDRSTFGETIFLFCSVPEFRGAGGRRRRGFSLSSAGEILPAEMDLSAMLSAKRFFPSRFTTWGRLVSFPALRPAALHPTVC